MTKFDDLWTSLSENATQRSEQRIDELFDADPRRHRRSRDRQLCPDNVHPEQGGVVAGVGEHYHPLADAVWA